MTKKKPAAKKTTKKGAASKIVAAATAAAVATTVLVLRTCAADMTSRNDFRWPESGPVEAPDWEPTPECGNGLHGLLWGKGNANLMTHSKPDSKWLVVEVDATLIVDLGDKVKFPRGNVIHAGDRETAIKMISARAPEVKENETYVVFGTASATGDSGTASATGYSGTASATGDRGTASATGDRGTASATGDSGTASATGDRGTASATGYSGTASATGYSGTASATGDRGTASATGDSGTASATGDSGTASATGYSGTASATGDRGTAEAGPNGIIVLAWWDETAKRKRLTVGYVGEDGIEAKVKYCLNDKHCFERVED